MRLADILGQGRKASNSSLINTNHITVDMSGIPYIQHSLLITRQIPYHWWDRTDWEVWEDPKKYMNFMEAVEQMKLGKWCICNDQGASFTIKDDAFVGNYSADCVDHWPGYFYPLHINSTKWTVVG